MNAGEKKVYHLLCKWRKLMDIKQAVSERLDLSPQQRLVREQHISKALSIMAVWLQILTDDERFIIKRHLIDGACWKLVVCEFNTKLRRSYSRSLSTMRRMQQRSLQKIVAKMDSENQNIREWILDDLI